MPTPNEHDTLRGLTDCARVWGMSRDTLNKLLATGRIKYVRLPGGTRRVADSAMREWIERESVYAGKPPRKPRKGGAR